MAALRHSLLFNGPVETGLRALILLTEAYPESLELQRLVALDHLLIHSGDVEGGPASIHPPSPLRAGEVAVRRELLERGLLLYISRGLVERRFGPDGVGYVADDGTGDFLDTLRSRYVTDLRERAAWLFGHLATLPARELQAVLTGTIERWRAEFVPLNDAEED
jgi:hypothetical protein